jgi:protein gp37
MMTPLLSALTKSISIKDIGGRNTPSLNHIVMSNNSAISWTNATLNIWRGCSKISEGCKYCYMYRDSSGKGRKPFDPTALTPNKDATLKNSIPKVPGSKVFCGSLMDFYWEKAPADLRNKAYTLFKANKHVFFQVLTKRAGLIKSMLPTDGTFLDEYNHVWLGVSAENQQRYDERVAELVRVPSKTRFISAEPLLGPIDLKFSDPTINGKVHWVIVGGESGNQTGPYRYRECKLEWIEDIIKQCVDAGVPVFVKQTGSYLQHQLGLKAKYGTDITEFPESIRYQQFPDRTLKVRDKDGLLKGYHCSTPGIVVPVEQFEPEVIDHEQYEMDKMDTSVFFQKLTDCFVPSQKAQSVELVHTASIAILSTLFTSARILDNDGKPKSMNLFLGVVGPPASGKSMVLAPLPLISGVEGYVENTYTTAGVSRGMPDKTVRIPADITKPRLIDYLWVNDQTDTPTLILESESSTLVNSLSSQHGGFRDVLNKLGENEPVSYSRVSGGDSNNGRTVKIDYPMASMVLTGTYDQAERMYELPSGTFSRYLYFTLTGTEEFQPLKKYDGPAEVNAECREFLANRILELYQFCRGQGILVDPNQEVLDAYNAFAASRHKEGKALLKGDASFIYRYVFRILKIAGVYALIRTWLQSGVEKYGGSTVEITMDDFNSAMILEPTLWDSHLQVYNLVNGKATNPHAAIVNALGTTFTTADFKAEYQKQRNTLPDNRSITRYLKSLIQDQLIDRTQKGTFLKL